MNLAIVTNILTPYRLPLFEHLAKCTKSCTVLLQAEREENRQWRLPPVTFNVEVLPGLHFRPSGAEVSIHMNYGVLRRLRRLQPDVVLSGGFAAANIAAYVYCRLYRKRYVPWGELTLSDGADRSMLRRVIRRVLVRGADGYIASSKAAHDAFVHYGARPESVLTSLMPIAVDEIHRETLASRQAADYTELRRRLSSQVLLYVGRLTDRKGLAELFSSYEQVIAHRPDTSLVLVGDGPDRPKYESLVRERGWQHVHFIGFIGQNLLPTYLALPDLFVFPTWSDTYGAVLAEAMAAELPVLSSIHAAATQDLVEEGVTGFKMDPGDTTATANKILEVLAMSHEQRQSIGRAAYEQVRACDIAPTADRMIRFLRTIVYGKPANGEDLAQSFQ